MNRKNLLIPIRLGAQVEYRPPASARDEVFLLLHGYSLVGSQIFKKLEPVLPPGAAVVAPNGPFLVPQLLPDGSRRAGYAWYFYHPATDEYVVGMEPALEFLSGILRELGFVGRTLRVIGFSQGGYLAPFLVGIVPGIRQVIGVASRALDDELAGRDFSGVRIDSVHGEKDEVVDAAGARASHAALLRQTGSSGVYREVPGEGHRIGPGVLAELRALVNVSFAE